MWSQGLAPALLILTVSAANAQILGAQVKAGDVYVQTPGGTARLSHSGRVKEVILSRDHELIAYMVEGPETSTSTVNDLYVCSAPAKDCVLAVHGSGMTVADDNDFEGLFALTFSLQAGVQADGTLIGSVYFLTNPGMARLMTVHRLVLTGKTIHQILNSPAPALLRSMELGVEQTGRYAGALDLVTTEGQDVGGCGTKIIFDPNTRKVLRSRPVTEC